MKKMKRRDFISNSSLGIAGIPLINYFDIANFISRNSEEFKLHFFNFKEFQTIKAFSSLAHSKPEGRLKKPSRITSSTFTIKIDYILALIIYHQFSMNY